MAEKKPKTAKEWRVLIEKCMQLAGTYSECFELPLRTLSEILEKREKAEAEWMAAGGQMTVEHVNQGGQVYIEQNPAVRLINDLNRDALTYMRECGITPKGLKQIKEAPLKAPEKDPLMEILNKLDADLNQPEEGETEVEKKRRKTFHEKLTSE